MATEKLNFRFSVLTLMVIAATFSRIIPHPYSFTPMGTIALFGAAYFSKKIIAFIIPLISMWLSDIVIQNTIYAGLYNHFWLYPENFPFNYFAFFLTAALGILFLKEIKIFNIIGAGISAAVLFFLISNFGDWVSTTMYPKNLSGLISCYAVGVPYFGNMLASNLFYSAILFGVFELAQRKFLVLSIKTSV